MTHSTTSHIIDGLNVEITHQKGEIKTISISGLVVGLNDHGDVDEAGRNFDLIITRKSSDSFESICDGCAECVFHANWTPIPRQSGQSERSDAGVLVYL